jgi:hypothetical protein
MDACAINSLIVLNQEFLRGLVKQVYPRVDDCHKKPADIPYSLTEDLRSNVVIRPVIFSNA